MIITNFNEFINENYKSDDDIAAEFNDFKIEQLDFETRDMSYMYADNTFEGTIYWEFPYGDEHVGGGSDTTTEEFYYNTDNKSFQYVCNAWYPTETFQKMVDIIKEKLQEKYQNSFTYYKSTEFNKINEK